jgi:hypothetical protein
MPAYKFIHEIAEMFPFLSHGVTAKVTRADKKAPEDVPETGVVLNVGDVVETTEPVEHAHLQLISPVEAPADTKEAK